MITVTRDDVGYGMQGLQEVFDIMRHPGPGFVYSLQVSLLREFAFPRFRHIEVVNKLYQKFAVQVQGAADGTVAVQRDGDFLGTDFGAVNRSFPEFPFGRAGLPFGAGHPRQGDKFLHGGLYEFIRRAFPFKQVIDFHQPLFERRANVKYGLQP